MAALLMLGLPNNSWAAAAAWNDTNLVVNPGLWSLNTNWTPNGVPINSTTITFADNSTLQHAISLGGAAAASTITFATGTGSNPFVFDTAGSGNILTISGGITNNDAQTEVFNNIVANSATQTWTAVSGAGLTFSNVNLGANLTLSGAGNFTFGNGGTTLTNTSSANRTLTNSATGTVMIGAVNLSNGTANNTLTIAGAGATSITGIIANGGTSTSALTYSGTGSLTLSGANTYSGTTTLSSGTLIANNNFALGTGTLNLSTAGVTLESTNSSVLGNAVTLGANASIQDITLSGTVTQSGGSRTITNNGASGVTLSGTVDLTNSAVARTLTLAGSGATSIIGTVQNGGAGAGSLTINSTGAVTLSGANTYTGGTKLTAGTLNLNNSSALGTGTFTIAGGTIDSTGASAVTISGIAESWTNSFTFAGTGQNLTLGKSTDAITLGANLTITANAAAAQDLTVAGIIGGLHSLTKAGNGTLTLSGANTYTAGTVLNAGTLNINGSTALGTGTFTIGGGTIDNTSGGAVTLGNIAQNWNSNFTFTGTNNLNLGTGAVTLSPTANITVTTTDPAGKLIVGGVISDAGFGLTKAGAGQLTLNGVNTYTGATTISAGTLQLGGSGSLNSGNYSGAIANAGTLEYSSSANQTFSGAISGGGAITKDTSTTSILTLSGTNTFTGGINLNAGTVKVSTDNNLGGANNLTFNGGTLEAANSFILGSSASRTLTINGIGNALQIDSGKTLTLAAASSFSGTGTLAVNGVDGTGTLKLGANQTFSGTLDLANATLSLAGFKLTVGTLDITANSIIDFGGSSSSSILSVTNLILAAGVTLTVNNWNDTKEYFYAANNPGATISQISFGAPYAGDTTKWLAYTDGPGPGHEVTPVPEPATYGVLFTAAAVGLFFWFRLKANARRAAPVRIAIQY